MNLIDLSGNFISTVKILDFLSIDASSIIFTLINTLILFLVIKYLLFERVNKVLEERSNDISTTYSKADEAMNNAKKLEADYNLLLSNAKEESAEIIKNATKKAQIHSDEIIAQAKTEANNIVLRANEEIERERKRTKSEIKDEISEIAIIVAEKVIGKELSKTDHELLIDKFIENVGELK